MPEPERYMERTYDALESAKILLENGKYSNSITQAYYAMFYVAKSILSLKDLYPRTHRGVITKLGLEFVGKGFLEEPYGEMIARGLQLREKADYDAIIERVEKRQRKLLQMLKNSWEGLKEL
jgi:uncharacterized protein (UPF0332 family)